MVKELRERTGAGMMECKKALVEANGDLEAAAEALRKSGQAKADKKAGRVAADGRVVIAKDGSKAVIVEVNSETDFVAKDENFIGFAESVAAAVAASGETNVAALASQDIGDGRSIEQARTDLVQKVGENISVRRASIVQADGPIAFYTHGALCTSLRLIRFVWTSLACLQIRWSANDAFSQSRPMTPASRPRLSKRWLQAASPSS
jgi:elongation factor Ts